MAVYSSRVWLVRAPDARLALRGLLELDDRRLLVVLDDRRAPAPALSWLRARLGADEPLRRLGREGRLVVVDRPVDELHFRFVGPEHNLEVADAGVGWLLRFTAPGTPRLLRRWQARQERKAGRWRELLAGALDEPPPG